ncbi:MAG: family 16 glycosylhydrolase [Cyclobacteriaceae bacterium]
MACNEDEQVGQPGDPSDLVVDLGISEGNTGTVTVNVSAVDAVEYQFIPGDDATNILTNTTGNFSYTYEATGVYEVEIKAIGSNGRFLRQTQEITVQVGDPTGPIQGDNGYITPLIYDGMTLVWQDEFNGSSLDESDWNYEIGTGSNGWGNNELQYYRRENTSVSDGFLTIEAREESFGGNNYTSSRLTTQGKAEFLYGRIDIRAQLPEGQGVWPALWMLGSNFASVGWPACGEIDIMEMIGGGEGRDDTVHGTIHWDNNGTKADTGGKTQLASGKFSDQFHVFTLQWDADKINWYVNDRLYYSVDTTPAALSEFRNEFFFIFNIAVGGNWPGSPNASTSFPQKMVVDYVRVFQKN